MKSSNTLKADGPVSQNSGMSRRSFFHRATVAGAAGAAALYGLINVTEAFGEGANQPNASANSSLQVTTADTDILVAAQIAEALAVTTSRAEIPACSGVGTRSPGANSASMSTRQL